jgi:restriction system protein
VRVGEEVGDDWAELFHNGTQSLYPSLVVRRFGPSSYEFANGKPLQLIDGSGLLALCQEHNIPARIAPISGTKSR